MTTTHHALPLAPDRETMRPTVIAIATMHAVTRTLPHLLMATMAAMVPTKKSIILATKSTIVPTTTTTINTRENERVK